MIASEKPNDKTDRFSAKQRPELKSGPTVFFVTSWGYAADHLYGWFSKTLNLHPEIFALLAHEGSRPKYIRETTRSERPSLPKYVNFLTDVGMTYEAIGDCYSYRAAQIYTHLRSGELVDVPVLNLVRHPIIWLEYFVEWRAGNMRMPGSGSDPLAWEWLITPHRRFRALGLKDYEKSEISIWATYLGMTHLNRILADQVDGVIQMTAESVFSDRDVLAGALSYLSKERCSVDDEMWREADSMRQTLFRGERFLHLDAEALWNSWEGWKCDAFRALVSKDAMRCYRATGYDLFDLDTGKKFGGTELPKQTLQRDVFVSSMFKSGTWLLRSAINALTGLTPYEPHTKPGEPPPDYSDEMLISFPKNSYFSWHTMIGPRVASMLESSNCKKIFLVRNIYSVLASAVHHIVYDVDAGVGGTIRSNDNVQVDESAVDLKNLPITDAVTLMIAGFTSPVMTWYGLQEQIKQMATLLKFAASHDDVVLVSYEQLVHDRERIVRRLAKYLNADNEQSISDALTACDPETMRNHPRISSAPEHIMSDRVADYRKAIRPHHVSMVQFLLWKHFPDFTVVSQEVGLPWLFSSDAITDKDQPFKPRDLHMAGRYEVSSRESRQW